ncbi:GNAT family N-acetyltransferase [Streptomyces axinellae]|uniref:GNAT family N-acetyltransferase n=1 Tax=Streptomyces axinellae TaxID=552788 RepID=A0ABP6CBW6_9ACTN
MAKIILRPAEPAEADILTALTQRSKSHWGYTAEELERNRDMLTVSPREIRDGRVVVAERNGDLAGYYQLGGEPPDGELSDMFLDPEVIGTGLGRILWQHATESARAAGFRTLTWDSDPHAEPFYLHMGAERIGSREVAPGRVLVVMKATLPPA